jgi:hypothetical protein
MIKLNKILVLGIIINGFITQEKTLSDLNQWYLSSIYIGLISFLLYDFFFKEDQHLDNIQEKINVKNLYARFEKIDNKKISIPSMKHLNFYIQKSSFYLYFVEINEDQVIISYQFKNERIINENMFIKNDEKILKIFMNNDERYKFLKDKSKNKEDYDIKNTDIPEIEFIDSLLTKLESKTPF